MSFSLGDDGTLDTLIVCNDCNAELRYNFDGDDDMPEYAYGEFVKWAKNDATETHICGE